MVEIVFGKIWSFWNDKLTNDTDAEPAFLRTCGESIKDAAVAAIVVRLHLLDGDVAGVVVVGDELHVGFLMADPDGHTLFIRQEPLVLVEPTDLSDGLTCCHGDVAAEREGVTCLCDEISRDNNLTWWKTQAISHLSQSLKHFEIKGLDITFKQKFTLLHLFHESLNVTHGTVLRLHY